MADRNWHKAKTQGVNHVTLNFSVTLAAGAPVFVEGDKAASAAGSYLTLTDTGTGQITVTTVDPYLAIVSCVVSRSLATPTGNAHVECGLPSQDSTTKKWSVLIATYTNSAGTFSAADIVAGDRVEVTMTLRNSAVLP